MNYYFEKCCETLQSHLYYLVYRISSDVGSDILSNGHITNSSSEGSTENIFNDDSDKKSVEIKPAQIQTTP